MCLDTATDRNDTRHTVPGDKFDADINLGYEKIVYNELADCNNKNLYIPIAPILSDESAIPMIADEDAVDHIPKNHRNMA